MAAKGKGGTSAALDWLARGFVCLMCLAGFTALLWGERDRITAGANDFIPLYVAATEVGGPALYDRQAYYDFQQERFGEYSDSLIYSRPPYYALLLKPLTWLGSFEAAYGVYWLLRATAIFAFLMLWPRADAADAVLYVCLSFPLISSLANGQDVAFLLPLLALALRFEGRGKPFHAGITFALCAFKFHLLILLPATLIAQKRWDVLRGLAAGAAALIAVSFAAGGWSWPSRYADILLLGELHPNPDVMPNLNGLLASLPGALGWEIAGGAATIVVVALAARRGDFALGLGAAALGSLLVSRHAYMADLVILLPGLLATAQRQGTASAKLIAFAWLGPVLPLLLVTGHPLSYIPQVALAAALAGYALLRLAGEGPVEQSRQTTADAAA